MSIYHKNLSKTNITIQNILAAFCAVGTVLIIWSLLKYSKYGFDFTDESFYIVWMANPFLYDWSTTQFGFIYHPLYRVLGGDITNLRQANIMIIFALAWPLSYYFIASLDDRLKGSGITLLIVSAGLATSAFIIFDTWLPTPSYNSLNLQALMVTALGLFFAEKNANFRSVFGWVLIGIGGWLSFMAKPVTAIAMGISMFFYLLFARKFSIRLLMLSISLSLALLIVSAILIDGSVLGFIKRLQVGVELYGLLDAGYSISEILRIDSFKLGTKFKLEIFIFSGVLALALCSMCTNNKKYLFFGLAISIFFFLITVLFTSEQIYWTAKLGFFQNLFIFSIIFAPAIATLVLKRLTALNNISQKQCAISVIFLVMPYIYAVGTNNNYWHTGAFAGIFWLLAGLTLLIPLIRGHNYWFLLLTVALATQAVTIILLQTGFEDPYRQPQPLRVNATTLETPTQLSGLLLPQGFADYITSAYSVVKTAFFNQGTPVIDLTGQSPGLLYAIGAENIGQPWTVGGYPGSQILAKAALDHVSCEKISKAWILLEPNGPLNISTELLQSLGADFPSSYEAVGSWQTAQGAGGFQDRPKQEIYKPINQHKTLMACQRLREEAKQ